MTSELDKALNYWDNEEAYAELTLLREKVYALEPVREAWVKMKARVAELESGLQAIHLLARVKIEPTNGPLNAQQVYDFCTELLGLDTPDEDNEGRWTGDWTENQ